MSGSKQVGFGLPSAPAGLRSPACEAPLSAGLDAAQALRLASAPPLHAGLGGSPDPLSAEFAAPGPDLSRKPGRYGGGFGGRGRERGVPHLGLKIRRWGPSPRGQPGQLRCRGLQPERIGRLSDVEDDVRGRCNCQGVGVPGLSARGTPRCPLAIETLRIRPACRSCKPKLMGGLRRCGPARDRRRTRRNLGWLDPGCWARIDGCRPIRKRAVWREQI